VKPVSTCHVSSSDSPFSHLYASVQKRPTEARPTVMAGKSDGGKEPAGNTATLTSNLNELDSLLAELSSSQFAAAADNSDQHPPSCMYERRCFALLIECSRLPDFFSVLCFCHLPSCRWGCTHYVFWLFSICTCVHRQRIDKYAIQPSLH